MSDQFSFMPRALELYEQSGSTGGISGVVVPKKPNTHQELVSMLAETIPDGSFFGFTEDFIAVIGASQDPDEIVSQLPYDEQAGLLHFILPPPEEKTK